MRMIFRRFAVSVLLSVVLLAVGAASPTGVSQPAMARGPGQVYLLRGLANVFSLGMDQIGDRLTKDGISAKTFNHTYWTVIADEIIADYKGKRRLGPIAIVGHSFGATAATMLSARLAEQHVPVALLVAIDPSYPVTVSPNVRRAIAFHTVSFPALQPAAGFHGSLINVAVTDAGHITVDKSGPVQDRTIAEIKRAFGRR